MTVAADIKKRQNEQQKLSCADNAPVRNLLDVVSGIIADELIQTAKKNPEVFKEKEGQG